MDKCIKVTPDSKVSEIYYELLRRMENLSIALAGRRRIRIDLELKYDITKTGTPRVKETEYAFYMWNCAILTAFRNLEGLSKEENLKRNIKRNEELKGKLFENELLFRSVSGMYREAHWEKPVKEICFFVTNTDAEGNEKGAHNEIKDFFCKVYHQAEHFEQDSFLFTFPGANRVAFLVATNDNARKQFRGNIKFAGPLFTQVQDIGDWTQCSDGRISFRLKGMILRGGTGNDRIKIGEGNMFDIDDYNPNGIIVIRGNAQKDLKRNCEFYRGIVPLHEYILSRDQLSISGVQSVINQALYGAIEHRYQRIAIHCSASIGGSFIKGAKIALDTVRAWSQSHRRRFREIVMVDIYGEYSRVLAMEKESR